MDINTLVIIIIFFLLVYVFGVLIKNSNSKMKGHKIIEKIIDNSDTIYIVFSAKDKNVLYMSNNIENILGIKDKNNYREMFKEIFDITLIRDEYKKWDRKNIYISQMFNYDNPIYNYNMWIKVKFVPYKNMEDCYLLQIIDATKEHDHQHLLITQASNIKVRESQLDQITSKSYDLEMNINLLKDTFEFKYFKTDNMYFGEAKSGKFNDILDYLLNSVNDKDKELFNSFMSKTSLLDHFEKYELDSLSIRYRIGNDIKNNTWLESTIFFLSRKEKTISILTKNVTENAYEIRKQNVLLQNALNDAKLADKAKTDLITTISHDIRTPLTNIIGFSDSLLSQELDDNVKDDIKNISKSSNEVLDIIDSLLDTNNIEKALIEKQEREYNLLDLFKGVENETKEYLENKQVDFELNMDNNLPVILFGDDRRIKQAVNKIINNSIKYTDEGKIVVSVRGQKNGDNIKLFIEISDTGSGISKDKLKSIMNTDNGKSLSSVKKLIEALDGTFEIESRENEYTKVVISFMQKIVEDNKIREKILNNKSAEIFDLSGKKVLVVDDNNLNLKVTKRLLSQYNLDVTLLESGKECIDNLSSGNTYDLILMDQMMPGLSGTETLSKLKAFDNFNTKVIVLTADAMDGQKEKYLSEGFDDYISKPIDKKELSRVLKKYLEE